MTTTTKKNNNNNKIELFGVRGDIEQQQQRKRNPRKLF